MENTSGREQYWSEIDADEKIKRLREELKRTQRQLRDVRDRLFNMSIHQHAEDGTMLVRLNIPGGESPLSRLGEALGDDVYF